MLAFGITYSLFLILFGLCAEAGRWGGCCVAAGRADLTQEQWTPMLGKIRTPPARREGERERLDRTGSGLSWLALCG